MSQTEPTSNSEHLPEEFVITGRSDDLIEIYGDVRAEKSTFLNRDITFEFSEGTVVNLYWSTEDRKWKVDVIEEGAATVIHYESGEYYGPAPVTNEDQAVKVIGKQRWLKAAESHLDFTEELNQTYQIEVK